MLELKFGADARAVMDDVEAIRDIDRLRSVPDSVRSASNVEEFRNHLRAWSNDEG